MKARGAGDVNRGGLHAPGAGVASCWKHGLNLTNSSLIHYLAMTTDARDAERGLNPTKREARSVLYIGPKPNKLEFHRYQETRRETRGWISGWDLESSILTDIGAKNITFSYSVPVDPKNEVYFCGVNTNRKADTKEQDGFAGWPLTNRRAALDAHRAGSIHIPSPAPGCQRGVRDPSNIRTRFSGDRDYGRRLTMRETSLSARVQPSERREQWPVLGHKGIPAVNNVHPTAGQRYLHCSRVDQPCVGCARRMAAGIYKSVRSENQLSGCH
ncbi:hypothetical protein KM043_005479 [Ampulex compressa]|nr:hypothetical protein KM043_005479 [Ampulex compressa]